MQHQRLIRANTRSLYDFQEVRIRHGNRIAAAFRAKLGQQPGEKLDDEDAAAILADLRSRYKLITEGMATFPRRDRFKGDDVITEYAELRTIRAFIDMLENEKRQVQAIEEELASHEIYTRFLTHIRGCGPLMSACLISELDIHKARTASSFWRYCGLDIGPDGRGRGKYKEHMRDTTYIDAEGVEKEKKTLGYNPFIKTKVVGVLADCFLRSGSEYRMVYDHEKHRLESHAKYGVQNDGVIDDDTGRIITTKARRHNMAKRKMMKRFLADLHTRWCAIEGLPVRPPYADEHLDRDTSHHGPYPWKTLADRDADIAA